MKQFTLIKPLLDSGVVDHLTIEADDVSDGLITFNDLLQKYNELEKDYLNLRKAEKKLSDAYLRIRRLIGAYNTLTGGTNRFEVTEKRINELLDKEGLLDEFKQFTQKFGL